MATAASERDTVRRHSYHALTVRDVVEETHDTRTFVMDIPDSLADLYQYRPGQFCAVRIHVDGNDVVRCYSMSSAPAIDARLAVTVKRVPGGAVSNWLHDHVAAGDGLELTPPSGVFCERDGDGPLVAFCGGSGVTPVFSIVKQVLAAGTRRVELFYANRDPSSVIFGDVCSPSSRPPIPTAWRCTTTWTAGPGSPPGRTSPPSSTVPSATRPGMRTSTSAVRRPSWISSSGWRATPASPLITS